MTNTELYKKILKEEGLTQADAAKLTGVVGQGSIGHKLALGASIKMLFELTQVLDGYSVEIVKRSPKGKVLARYEIEHSK